MMKLSEIATLAMLFAACALIGIVIGYMALTY